jgi:hypothetical protein
VHDLPGVQYGYLARQDARHPQIMGDIEVGERMALLQIQKQIRDLGLRGEIERRQRLIKDQQFWSQGKRSRNRHALALTPAEFNWPPAAPSVPQFHLIENLINPAPYFRTAESSVVNDEWLSNDLFDGEPRIERRCCILKNQVDFFPDEFQLIVLDPKNVFSSIENASSGWRFEQNQTTCKA